MKRIFILLMLISGGGILSAQEKFGDCIVSALTNVDSMVNDTIYNSRKWKDCVMEKPIPDISFKTISGKDFDTKKLKGKVVVLNFWFIECQPCIAELPALNKLVKEYNNKDVLFFGITYQSLKSLNADFFPKYKFDFDIVQDAGNITEQFAAGYPTTYIIDKNGIVKAVWNGGFTGKEAEMDIYLKAKPVIDELLNKQTGKQQ
ncbi:MAG: TlpA disulfide reductase family protein [Bacteroidota bacterium]